MILSTFLKRVLILDAASCLSMGLLLALGAGALAPCSASTARSWAAPAWR